MKHQYCLINEDEPQAFVTAVSTAMADGWVPLGGVATATVTRYDKATGGTKIERLVYSQAMLRRGVNGIDIVH